MKLNVGYFGADKWKLSKFQASLESNLEETSEPSP